MTSKFTHGDNYYSYLSYTFQGMCSYSTRDQKNRTTNFVFSGIQSQVGDCRFTPTVRYWWLISSFRIFKVTLRKLATRNSAPSFQSSKLSGHGKMMRTRNEGQYRHFNSSKFPGQTLQDSSVYIINTTFSYQTIVWKREKLLRI